MMEFRESPISAHHNYLVNGMLTQGFVVDDPESNNGFFLLADVVPQGETRACISARLMDEEAHPLLELKVNRIGENPGKCSTESAFDGYRILRSSGDVLIEVRTKAFANGYLTCIKARLFDEHGRLRIETRDESVWIQGEDYIFLADVLQAGGAIRGKQGSD
jgi:hypothetical protein